jgi:hypothetical protein
VIPIDECSGCAVQIGDLGNVPDPACPEARTSNP